jgi:hypothetical protein
MADVGHGMVYSFTTGEQPRWLRAIRAEKKNPEGKVLETRKVEGGGGLKLHVVEQGPVEAPARFNEELVAFARDCLVKRS